MHGLDQGTGNSLAYYDGTAHRRVYSNTIGVIKWDRHRTAEHRPNLHAGSHSACNRLFPLKAGLCSGLLGNGPQMAIARHEGRARIPRVSTPSGNTLDPALHATDFYGTRHRACSVRPCLAVRHEMARLGPFSGR